MHYYAEDDDIKTFARASYLMMQGHTPELSLSMQSKLLRTLHGWTHIDYEQLSMLDFFTYTFMELNRHSSIIFKWKRHFDESGNPDSQEVATGFLRDMLQAFQYYPGNMPRTVIGVRGTTVRGDIWDFPSTYPIAISEYYSLYFVTNGEAVLSIEGEKQILPAYTFILIPPTCKCVIERNPSAEHWTAYRFYFKSRPEWIDLVSCTSDFSFPYLVEVQEPEAKVLMQDMDELIRNSVAKGSLKKRLVFSLMESILIRVKDIGPNKESNSDNRITCAINFMLENLDENHSVKDIAALVNMSSSHFSHQFRAQIGISVLSWRDQTRMVKAADLLRNTKLSIAEVGTMVGYKNQLYFARRFQKLMNMSPSAYRSDV